MLKHLHLGSCTGTVLILNSTYLSFPLWMCFRLQSYIFLSGGIEKLTTTLSRGSIEVGTPVFSNEGLALCDLPSPTDVLDPIDYRSVCLTVKSPMYKEIPSPRRRSNHSWGAYSPTAKSPPSPSENTISGISPTNSREQNVVISHASSSPNEKELGFADPLFSPPKRERETRRASLVFRPTSSGGPALQTLSPPPVKVNLAVRRGITLPNRLPPAPLPQGRRLRSIEQSQLPYESVHNVSEPGSPTSLTPEEGLMQFQIWTQQSDSNTPLGYRRSFEHIRGLSPRTHPTSALPQISTIRVPINNTRPDSSDNAVTVTRSEVSPIGSISKSSSGESEPLSTPPDDAIPDIIITRIRKGPNAPSGHLHSSARAGADKYASSFLDFEPGTPRSPRSPATQSPFGVAQSQLLTCCGRFSFESADVPPEQSGADTSIKGYEEQVRSDLGGVGITGGYRTRAVVQSQRRRKSGVRRSHRPRSKSGTTATGKGYNRASGGIISAIRGAGVFPEINSRMADRGRSPSRVT
jgi:hypothetical protein